MKHNDWIVSGGDDGFARIYDLQTGKFVQRLDHGGGKSSYVPLCIFAEFSHSRRTCANGGRKLRLSP